MGTKRVAMANGFYDLTKTNTKTLRAIFLDALWMSYKAICESKYTEVNPERRGVDTKYSLADFMEMVDRKNHNVFIDRSVRHSVEREGEVGFSLNSKYDTDWHQTTFFLTLENLREIAEKYDLQDV